MIAILGVLTGIITLTFSSQTNKRSVEGEALSVLAVLDQARSLAMSSKENTQYGVHFSATTKTLFVGNVYDPDSSTNQVNTAAAAAEIVDISLAGGGSTVVFDKLTGRTSNYGTIKIQSVSDNSASTTIAIYQTGLNEIEQ